jgi:hypothetical protein
VRFQLALIAARLSLHPDGVEPLVLRLRKDHELTVTLSSVESHGDVSLSCVVETEFELKPRMAQVFEDLAHDRLPPGHLPREEWGREFDFIDGGGNVQPGHIVPMHVMPAGFQDFGRQLAAELRAAADAAVGVLRWRSRTLGSPQPFASRGIEWSPDGETWRRLPSTGFVRIGDVARLEITEATASELQALLDQSELEPLAHTLFREAWSQRHGNPRSALMLGITALEVGVKHYISACVPDATWLAENAPAPPVVLMLQDYLPTLEPPDGGERLQPFDDAVEQTLTVGIRLRNELTHRGADVPSDRLMKTLRAVRNVLWRLDAARGHRWAAHHLFPSLEQDLSVGYRRI